VTRAGGLLGLDHVALPMENTQAMIAFYLSLGLEVRESQFLVQVYIGNQMLNLHRPGGVAARVLAAGACGETSVRRHLPRLGR
jgi:catechol 2,3-dioxygenase-like lactoylglutathione lyase family enzyme